MSAFEARAADANRDAHGRTRFAPDLVSKHAGDLGPSGSLAKLGMRSHGSRCRFGLERSWMRVWNWQFDCPSQFSRRPWLGMGVFMKALIHQAEANVGDTFSAETGITPEPPSAGRFLLTFTFHPLPARPANPPTRPMLRSWSSRTKLAMAQAGNANYSTTPHNARHLSPIPTPRGRC